MNDATVAAAIAERIRTDEPVGGKGAAMMGKWYGHRREGIEPLMLEAWRRFDRARPFLAVLKQGDPVW
ncbi:MAG: hypothetical protein GY788_25140 [bacterium]|nr:hypothetical protein [bacterium]